MENALLILEHRVLSLEEFDQDAGSEVVKSAFKMFRAVGKEVFF